MHGIFRLVSPGKANSHSTALAFVFSFEQCYRVSIPPAAADAYSFTTDGYGIFNIRTIWVRAVHTKGGSGTNNSAQELTRMDRKTVHLPHQGTTTYLLSTSPVIGMKMKLKQVKHHRHFRHNNNLLYFNFIFKLILYTLIYQSGVTWWLN